MKYLKYIMIGIIILALLTAVYYLSYPIFVISVPFAVSLLLAYLLNPILKFLCKKGVPQSLGILIIYLTLFLTFILLIFFIMPSFYASFNEFARIIPNLLDNYKIIFNEVLIRYELSGLPLSLKNAISYNIGELYTLFNSIITDITSFFFFIISNIFYIVLIPFITFYFMKDGEYLAEKIKMIIPSNMRETCITTWYRIDMVLKRFIRGELLIALIVGILTGVGMYIIGVRFSAILGIIAGITNIIPYLGPFIGVIPCAIIAFLQSPLLALNALLVFFIIQQLEAGVISPKIVGKCVRLHPITIIFIILLWEKVFGVWGMFFAVPVTSILIEIFNTILNNNIKIR